MNKTKSLYFPFLLSFFFLFACTDLDPVYERLDQLESDVSDLQNQINKLQEAWESAKIISDLRQINAGTTNYDKDGWMLTFTDGSVLSIFNGTDGRNAFTPLVKIDNEGYWIVTYDGLNYDYITDSFGNPMSAIGINGTDGNDGKDGEDGSDGKDGNDGLNVRVVIGDDNCYVFEVYHPSDPENVLDSIPTPISSESSSAISSIVRDDISGTVTFTMADGSVFVFELQKIVPSSIIILAIDSFKFSEPEQEISFDIRINPSNIIFNYNVASPDCDIELGFLGVQEDLKVDAPCLLSKIEPTKDKDDNLIEGQFTVYIKDANNSIFNYREGAYLKLRYSDSNGDSVYITSNVFIVEFTGDDYLLADGVIPVMVINTPSPITSKEIWMENCNIDLLNTTYTGAFIDVNMKGRGNSTWEMVKIAKKPYAIKLDKKSEMLGLPKHKRWVLLANVYDKSNLRNEVAFFLGRMSKMQPVVGMDYTPRSRFVRVIMNDKYMGLYQLTEQLKIDENRVNVGDDGFLLEIDARAKQDEENVYFNVPHIAQSLVIKDPDVIEDDENFNYVKDLLTKADEALFSANFKDENEGYRKYLNVESFIDWYLVNEITKNPDSRFQSSCFMNLSHDGLINMGPVWDFDISIANYPEEWNTTGNTSIYNPEGFYVKSTTWINQLFKDPYFADKVKERYSYYFNNRQNIYDYIDSQAALISNALLENDRIWNFYSNPYDETLTYQAFHDECNEIKEWLELRLQWMNTEFNKL